MVVDRDTGETIDQDEDIKQSIDNILVTPQGFRPMRPDYGSRLHELVDSPMNSKGIARIVGATADAVADHEPRIQVERVLVNRKPGELDIEVRAKAIRARVTLP